MFPVLNPRFSNLVLGLAIGLSFALAVHWVTFLPDNAVHTPSFVKEVFVAADRDAAHLSPREGLVRTCVYDSPYVYIEDKHDVPLTALLFIYQKSSNESRI